VAADPEVKSKTLIFIWFLTFTPLSASAGGGWIDAETAGQLFRFARPAFICTAPGTCISRRDSVGRVLLSAFARTKAEASCGAQPRDLAFVLFHFCFLIPDC